MNLIAWLIFVVLAYAALTVWVSHLLNAIRWRRIVEIVALLAVPFVLWLIVPFLPPVLRIILCEALLAGLAIVIAKVASPKEPLIPARELKPSLLHLALVSGSALFLIPLFWMIVTSLKEDSQTNKFPPEWLPTQQSRMDWHGAERGLVWMNSEGKRVRAVIVQAYPDGTEDVQPISGSASIERVSPADVTEIRHVDPVWSNYPDALKFLPAATDHGLLSLQNTLIIAIMSVTGTVLSCSLVAYGFSRLNWPGRDFLFGLVLATMMLPDAVLMMPRFLIFRSFHWIDTLYPLWVPSFFASAFNIFLLRQFFMSIPKELEDAAKIDGCGYFTTYWRVMLPMIRPALAAVAVMTFIGAWRDFLGPLIYISSPEKMPLSYILQLFNSAHGGEPAMLMAATTLVILPVIVLFFFTQRYFIEGVTLTGLGGR